MSLGGDCHVPESFCDGLLVGALRVIHSIVLECVKSRVPLALLILVVPGIQIGWQTD